MKKAGAPENNKNAEKWDVETARQLMLQALDYSKEKGYDFIGEIARDLNVSRHIFTYLVDKYDELEEYYDRILTNVEANCFKHGKKGKINTAMAIVNLKSNHGWTDRTSVDANVKTEQPLFGDE